MQENPTQSIYNKNASRWSRHSSKSLSDYTARQSIFDLCGNLAGKSVLDIGCGEGYCSRYLKVNNLAHKIHGIDISSEMVKVALDTEESDPLGITYSVGDISNLSLPKNSYDLILGVFVYNYVSIAEMQFSMREVYSSLKDNGRFIFAVPHPAFPFIRPTNKPPFYFDFNGDGYFSSRDKRKFGEIYKLDNVALPVQMVHKLFEDYFASLKMVGFSMIPDLKELKVEQKHIELNPKFFMPLIDTPLHLLFSIQK